ncbi:HrgC protein [Fusobacterium pseudoperiodonticum]|uniref:HrgC protein n=1 Tax=Fusobacterium pseudoperiodonticum TaxID=2663009 RepID=A0AAD0ARF9_9FUSO|nr:HrgC protein [Fusobacterium pseudoperiodonticum]ATV66348.1 HrgC protein [Fusobacterium pseudoperiodonticum]
MSIKVRLEKDNYLKNAYVGFSWTTFFFGFWVPLFRKNFRDFAYFFMFFLCKILVLVVYTKELYKIIYTAVREGRLEVSYYIIVPFILIMAIYQIDIFLAYAYNKYFTTKMFEKGFYLVEKDEYSAAILKDYTYLPYTEEEFNDEELLKRYEQHAKRARKAERKKLIIAISLILAYYVLVIGLSLIAGQ